MICPTHNVPLEFRSFDGGGQGEYYCPECRRPAQEAFAKLCRETPVPHGDGGEHTDGVTCPACDGGGSVGVYADDGSPAPCGECNGNGLASPPHSDGGGQEAVQGKNSAKSQAGGVSAPILTSTSVTEEIATKHPSLLKLEAALLADGCETATAYVHQDTLSVETMRRDPDGQKWHSLCRRTNAAPEDIDDRRIKLIVDIERRIWDRHLFNATDARSPA